MIVIVRTGCCCCWTFPPQQQIPQKDGIFIKSTTNKQELDTTYFFVCADIEFNSNLSLYLVKLIMFGVFVLVLYQKRLKKERKARRRLQDQLELEMKRRSQYEDALKNSAAGDALRLINGKLLTSL